MVGCFGVLFFLHSGSTDDVCKISYAMVEEAMQVLFSIWVIFKKMKTFHFQRII
jgi:hypothetical protein